jgi:molybdate transport system substrate-binding protein
MRRFMVIFLAVLAIVPACSGDETTEGGGGQEEVVVLAASSLTAAFTEMEDAFEGANPEYDLVFTFDSSSTLATQVSEGGPGDVLATAAESNMDDAVDSGNVGGEPEVFTGNSGVIAVPAGSDAVSTPEDLEGDVLLAVCAEGVPCRVVADEMFSELGIDPEVDSEEENVSAVVTKLEAGEVDAGVVYVTDDLASDDVEAIDIGDVVVTTDYPIATVTDSEGAQAFVDFVLGDEGQSILEDNGFVAS